jgi:glycosyltransferase involved in cell wall biosynthesis
MEEQKTITVITAVYNNVRNIEETIQCVLLQNYSTIEYIIIDGGSTDGTLDIIEKYQEQISIFVSEQDYGIYDALNKGINLASGDVIVILHSDDIFCDKYVVSDMMNKMSETNAEFCFSDLVIVDNTSGKIIRYYMAHYFRKWLFRIGWMPPHPTCFIHRSVYEEFGLYSLDYKVAADFDYLVRIFFARDINWTYLNRITVKMRLGGVSNAGLNSKVIIAGEIKRSLKVNNVRSLPFFQLGRYIIRLIEMLVKPKPKESCVK